MTGPEGRSSTLAEKIRACRCDWPHHEEWAQQVEQEDAAAPTDDASPVGTES